MKTKKLNAEHIWKQLDDLLVPRLRLGPIDRAAYCHLLRHTRLEGKLQLRFSIPWLARGICLGPDAASRAVRRLVDHQALRLLECSNAGHVAEVRLPEEILADLPPKVVAAGQPEGIRIRSAMQTDLRSTGRTFGKLRKSSCKKGHRAVCRCLDICRH